MEFVHEEALTRAEALEAYRRLWTPEPPVEVVGLDEAVGRVLAEGLSARYDLPVVRASQMDGVAVRSRDFAEGLPDTSGWAEGRDFVRADTGDDFPDEFDATVAIEDVAFDDEGRPRFKEGVAPLAPGANVSPAGSLARRGAPIAPAGAAVSPEVAACAAIGGYAQLKVVARPRVAFVPTGSELVPWGSFPKRGQNFEANSVLAAGLLRSWGALPVVYPIVRDDRADLGPALERALEAADIVVMNAGTSKGSEDYCSELLRERGSYFRHGVRCVPGRPVGMALVDGKPVVNAPGPVPAAWLCMDWLVRALVCQWLGVPVPARPRALARLAQDVRMPKPMERVVRMRLEGDGQGGLVAREVPRSAGALAALAEADALFTLPLEESLAPAGSEVEVELLRPLGPGAAPAR